MFNALIKQSYFVVGTDTDAGKTYVSCKLIKHFVAQHIATVGMKPIASGCDIDKNQQLSNNDARLLTLASNISADEKLINPYRFLPAIAPHIAADAVGVEIDTNVILDAFHALSKVAEVVIVEGAGGFLVPINQSQTLADLTRRLNLPIILVVGMRLGCINHALLTVEAIKARDLVLAGWVANQISPDMQNFKENLTTLTRHIDAPCLGVCQYASEV
jgi:dethiobiotin synthetase